MEISLAVAPGAHAILLLDQAGWHVSKRLSIPDNITLLPLPPKSPELNPVENICQFMRDNWLSNRIFKSHDDILDHCSETSVASRKSAAMSMLRSPTRPDRAVTNLPRP
jgi:transposase